MKNTTTRGRFARRTAAASATLALVATGALGVQTFADHEEGSGSAQPPPGEQVSGQPDAEQSKDGDLVAGSGSLIQTSGSNFDDTILTKYIPAHGFQVFQGEGAAADTISGNGAACLTSGTGSGGDVTSLNAPVELPDGARIKRISFYGQDDDPVEDIAVRLTREHFFTPFVFLGTTPVSTRTETEIDSFSTSGQQAEASVFFGANELDEFVGSPATGALVLAGSTNRFHSVSVALRTAAGAAHSLCGVRVDYQIPVSSADAGTVFHEIDPVRAFDSRRESFAESGLLAPGATKVVSIADGYDSAGVAIPAQANSVPANATAVAYNITVAGATGGNFVAVTAGDAASFTASAINYVGGSNIANAGTVSIAADRTIKLWGGNGSGSANVLIDIVGFYAPAPPIPNMAN